MKQDTIFAYTQSLTWFTWKWWFPNGCSFPRGWFSGFHVKLQGCNVVHFFPGIKQTNSILPCVHSFQVPVERGVWSLAEFWWSLANWRTPSNTLHTSAGNIYVHLEDHQLLFVGVSCNWMVGPSIGPFQIVSSPWFCLAAGPANLWGTKSFVGNEILSPLVAVLRSVGNIGGARPNQNPSPFWLQDLRPTREEAGPRQAEQQITRNYP